MKTKKLSSSDFLFAGNPLVLAVLLVFVTSVSLADSGFSNKVTLIIRGATVVDGSGGMPMENTTILVTGDRIKKIVPDNRFWRGSARNRIPSDVEVIDASGKWVIPGLVDAHMHYWESGRIYASPMVYDLTWLRSETEEHEWIRERMPYTLSRFLCSGVTTALDAGSPFWGVEVRNFAASTYTAPRIALTGRFIANFPDAYNMWEPDDGALVQARDPEHGRALVQEMLSWNVEVIKVGIEEFDVFTFENFLPTLEAIIDESHSAGVRVDVHIFSMEGAKGAMRAGADMLAHLPGDAVVDDEFLALAAENDVLLSTTISFFENISQVLDPEVPLNLLGIEQTCGDPEVIATWDDLADIPLEQRPPLPLVFTEQIMLASVARIHEAGIRIAAATDAGNIGTLHGAGLHRELEVMVEAGMSPMEVLVAATKNAAHLIDAKPDFGVLDKGNIADMLILSADPTLDISNTQEIEYVINKGTVFTHEELATMSPEELASP
ncbi:MAG: amidohydrolase family protein [Gammaproteobacteria bacterium]|nr:amidohydrolase family protein [Gammaproteobacteria bacterium]